MVPGQQAAGRAAAAGPEAKWGPPAAAKVEPAATAARAAATGPVADGSMPE